MEVAQKLKTPLDWITGKTSLEIVESDNAQLYLVDGKPLLFKASDTTLPTLLASEILNRLPKAVVDMGAVRFVCNGADVMAPGVRRYEGDFAKGDLIVVVDEKHGKPLALGESLYDSAVARATKVGPVIKSRHYVSDKVWDFAKTFME